MFKQEINSAKNVFLVRNVSFVKTRPAETREILFPRRMEGTLWLIQESTGFGKTTRCSCYSRPPTFATK